jgi:hypothetical protein
MNKLTPEEEKQIQDSMDNVFKILTGDKFSDIIDRFKAKLPGMQFPDGFWDNFHANIMKSVNSSTGLVMDKLKEASMNPEAFMQGVKDGPIKDK